MPSRRGFIGAVGAIGLAGSAGLLAASATPPAIWWSGWRQVPNQDLDVGWWSVEVTPDEFGRVRLVSTTLGVIQRTAPLDQINLTRDPTWPLISSRSTPDEKEAVQRRALAALTEAMAHV